MTVAEEINLDQLGLDHSPLVRSSVLTVDPPNLKDNTGLAERLIQALKETAGLENVKLPLSLARGLKEVLHHSDFKVWAAYQAEGGQGRLIDVRPVSNSDRLYGLAVDIGSTTLSFALVDLEHPGVIGEASSLNPQIEYGEDILTRARFADQPEGLDTLSVVLWQAINEGAAQICAEHKIETGRILAAALAGNTVMTHLLLGLSPSTLIREPYVPVLNRPADLKAIDLGFDIAPLAPVAIMPNKGSYFGGDLVAGLVTAGFNRFEEPCLMVDVGTNAEVVLGQKDWLIGAAGAAGPALEGGVTRMGMVAGPGAIDQVRVERDTGELFYQTMGGLPPRGICGSGLIDLFAELFLSDIIDFRGKLTLDKGHTRRVETDEGPAFVVVPGKEAAGGEPILLSDVEIDILMRSKAAMYTILETILKSVELSFDQIDRFFVAGTFGQYIDPRMAVAVGMLPDIPIQRYVSLGNSALNGLILILFSSQARAEVLDIWRRLTYLELNMNQDFMNRFSAARFIPHTHREFFPSVGTIIK
ncbi:MAG: DUF4445 domain-containing protein [Deltaproteobacteria bacterium]|nr:DUF4445 domain-containing protein [Deltaproteobacteria bacterium]MBW2052378.1 DUF4445 domain-containing protein [Deltaproteobacteria bacterium]MBW2142363.1 DUF4445 domain-containing protein [Deltaproteobacteria bacterium]MBW2322422.1 DUF4445 domain-containing protein [Deltaproteobacteria bacterium]